MRVLVTGGAGYIGSFIVKALRERGDEAQVIDDLREGHEEALAGAELFRGDFSDPATLRQAVAGGVPDAVIHMAASALVGESVRKPDLYYENNLVKSIALLDRLRRLGVTRFVFSSTAAVYGEPRSIPIEEDHATEPTNPYGASKLAFEQALSWYGEAYGVRSVSLRYFNAAGALPDGKMGEDHDPETHLIPNVLRAATGAASQVEIFGSDYPTEDGSCVRDYVHVLDLAGAHLLALDFLGRDSGEARRAEVLNLGSDQSISVRQVIAMAGQVAGTAIPVKEGPRRPGDPAVLTASSARARRILGWEPRYSDLGTILESALRWQRARPGGYGTSS